MLRMSFQVKGVVWLDIFASADYIRLGQDCMELGSGFGFSAYQAESLEGRLLKRANVTAMTAPCHYSPNRL